MKVSQLPPLTLTSAFCTYFSTEIDKGVVDTHTHTHTNAHTLMCFARGGLDRKNNFTVIPGKYEK